MPNDPFGLQGMPKQSAVSGVMKVVVFVDVVLLPDRLEHCIAHVT
jgi:hypothetical protein